MEAIEKYFHLALFIVLRKEVLEYKSMRCNPSVWSAIICIFSFALEYVEAFKCFDLNENGHLSTKELKYAMRMLGLNPTALEVQELVNGLDYEGKRRRNVNINGNVVKSWESWVVKVKPKKSIQSRIYFLLVFSQFINDLLITLLSDRWNLVWRSTILWV